MLGWKKKLIEMRQYCMKIICICTFSFVIQKFYCQESITFGFYGHGTYSRIQVFTCHFATLWKNSHTHNDTRALTHTHTHTHTNTHTQTRSQISDHVVLTVPCMLHGTFMYGKNGFLSNLLKSQTVIEHCLQFLK